VTIVGQPATDAQLPNPDGTGEVAKLPYSVESVRRSVHILEAVGRENGALTLVDVSRRVELSKATVFRLLSTLAAEGLIDQDPLTKQYRLGPRMIALGQQALDGTELVNVGRPLLVELTEAFPLIAYLNVPAPSNVLAIERVPRLAGIEFVRIGYEMPYHACASGLIFLAFGPPVRLAMVQAAPLERYGTGTIASRVELDDAVAQVRERGYAIDRNSLEEGVGAVAAPIRDHRGETVAAVGLTGTTALLADIGWDRVSDEALRVARAISLRLGYAPTDGNDGRA
jgi:IclR family KDG regulon transcriptional repressor